MDRLRKILKVGMILFIIGLFMILIMMWRDIEPGNQFFRIFLPLFLLATASVLIIGAILAFNVIIKEGKKDPKKLIKSFILRFVVLVAISFLMDYVKSKEVDYGYGIAYSLMLTIGTFYLEDTFIKD